jgi:hypothetical protein
MAGVIMPQPSERCRSSSRRVPTKLSNEPVSLPLLAFFRHSRTRECLLLGEELKSRLRHPTSESDP